MPKVSVILPTYNRIYYLMDAIQSVLIQEYEDFELIIVDDGSTDGTTEAVQKLKDNRIHYYYQENSGRSSARNVGLEKATGDYIAFIDSDDIWLPNKLRQQVEILDNSQEKIGVIHGGVIFFKEKKQKKLVEKTWKSYNYRSDSSVFDLLTWKLPMPIDCLLIRKKCFEIVGNFNEELDIHEDIELFVRILNKYEMKQTRSYVALCRNHQKNTRSLPSNVIAMNIIKFIDILFNSENTQILPSKVLIKKDYIYAFHYSIIANQCSFKGDKELSLKYYKKSFSYLNKKEIPFRWRVRKSLNLFPSYFVNLYRRTKILFTNSFNTACNKVLINKLINTLDIYNESDVRNNISKKYQSDKFFKILF